MLSPLHHLLLARTADVVPLAHVRGRRRRLGVVLLVVLATLAIVTVTPGLAWGAP